MTTLCTPTLLLRPLVSSDAAALTGAIQESMATVGRWMSWAHPAFGDADALAWVSACDAGRADGSMHEFGIFHGADGAFLGVAGLNQFNRVNAFCNFGYWVRESAQRQGTAVPVIDVLARHAFDALGQARVEIVVADGNLPSLGAARKAGATYECLARKRLTLHGQSVDAHMLSLVPPLLPQPAAEAV